MCINMTIKLYDQLPYEAEFDAVVIECREIVQENKKIYEAVLDQTLFFPEEGGQSPDCGTIESAKVLDVQLHKEVIIHTLDQPLEPGKTVHGCLDMKHRFFNMQQHSGEHIFSGLVHSMYGYENVGFHLSNQIVTMDFNGVITSAQAEEIEELANKAIAQNLPILVNYPSREELAAMEYRSKLELEGQVRIVTIPGIDVCACCAPHVRQTGEIGSLKVMGIQSYKGGVRISILCGFRALYAFREKAAVISSLAVSLSANQEGMAEAVEKLKAANQSLKSKLAAANTKLMEMLIAEILPEQEHVMLFVEEMDTPAVRHAVNRLIALHAGVCGIFSGSESTGYSFIMGSSSVDVRSCANLLKEKCAARGGGSAAMIQGSVQAGKEQILQALEPVLQSCITGLSQ